MTDVLRTKNEVAKRLRCSVKTVDGHVRSGALRYVIIGGGERRHHRRFTDADIDDLIEHQTRRNGARRRASGEPTLGGA